MPGRQQLCLVYLDNGDIQNSILPGLSAWNIGLSFVGCICTIDVINNTISKCVLYYVWCNKSIKVWCTADGFKNPALINSILCFKRFVATLTCSTCMLLAQINVSKLYCELARVMPMM